MAVVVEGRNFDSQFFLAGPLYIVDVNFLKIQMILVNGFNIFNRKIHYQLVSGRTCYFTIFTCKNHGLLHMSTMLRHASLAATASIANLILKVSKTKSKRNSCSERNLTWTIICKKVIFAQKVIYIQKVICVQKGIWSQKVKYAIKTNLPSKVICLQKVKRDQKVILVKKS